MEDINIIVTALLTLAGLYLAHNQRRQTTLRVAEKRLTAYAAMWEKLVVVSPSRLVDWRPNPLTQEEREQLFKDLTNWYYKDGNGMLLGGATRSIYLTAKDNLICPAKSFKPTSIAEKLEKMTEPEQLLYRSSLSIRQLSLLRSRMKADLEVYGKPYHTELKEDDKAFLKECNENLWASPWNVQ